MKISIFVFSFPPVGVGGTEFATFNIAKYLLKNHEVHIFTRLNKGLKREDFYQGIYVHRIPWIRIKFFGGIIFWLECYRILKKIKPDILHAQNMVVGKFVYLLSKINKKPYLIWARGSDVDSLINSKTNWILRKSLKNADAVISLTENMKEKIRKKCDREISVIPNGIDLTKLKIFSKNELREKFGLKKTEKIIIYVGSLRNVKGLTYLLKAMNSVNAKNKRLLIIGQGEDRKKLEHLVKELKISDYVTFLGVISNEEIFEYMASSDVFVLPSLSEGFPNVILEAMATGLPIIASRVGGIPEIVIDENNGFLVTPENPDQISEKINLIFKDEKLRKKISQNNKIKVKKYSWKTVIDKLEMIYLQIKKKNIIKKDEEEK